MIRPSVSAYLHRASRYGPDGATVLAGALTSSLLCACFGLENGPRTLNCCINTFGCVNKQEQQHIFSSDEIFRFHHVRLRKE